MCVCVVVVVVVYLSEFSFSDCTIIIGNTIYQDHNDCRSSKVPYIERCNSLLLKFQLSKASFGTFGPCHFHRSRDHDGLQDQLDGIIAACLSARLPLLQKERFSLQYILKLDFHITLTPNGYADNMNADTLIYSSL